MSKKAEGSLKVVGIDFHKTENTHLHHTNKFKNNNLIVRRGQEFKLKITFSRELKDNEEITLKLSIGEKPQPSNGTLLFLNTKSGKKDQGWHAKNSTAKGKEYLITVVSPANAIIGKYVLDVETRPEGCSSGKNFFYVLLNPWCKADSTFLPSDAKKDGYVLNDSGILYRAKGELFPQFWKFGQFEKDILDCCLYLLDKSKLVAEERRDPVKITRAMSAMVNKEEDEGVLFGKWGLDNSCDGHTCPGVWEGSVQILNQYYETKKPVLYGQCWVFSGVLTTVLRCLGIPTRSVTTYNAGVDIDGNLKIDHPKDFYWNFHVWNDVWMKRPDLPDGYDGWQAVDGTPVEKGGMFRCGPASLKAIKNGEVNLDYDTRFLFAAVNAKMSSQKIGTKIITQPFSGFFEDIMDDYKFPEDSNEGKKVLEYAASCLSAKSPPVQKYVQAESKKRVIPPGETKSNKIKCAAKKKKNL